MAVAVIVGLLLLDHTSNPYAVETTGRARSVTTTTSRSTTTTVPITTSTVRHDPASVKVLVLNGVDPKKALAGPASKALKNAGFTATTAHDAAATVPSSVVYAIAGFEGDATVISGLLGLPPNVVQVLPTPLPPAVGNPGDAQVVVVLGPDAPVSTG